MRLLLNFIAFAIFLHSSVALSTKSFIVKSPKSLQPPVTIAAPDETVQTNWIQQRVNNFDSSDERTWQMRYMENSFFLKDGGVVFILVGGETEINDEWLLGGHMRDMAIELQGAMFYVEHRYYGESRPTPDISPENLRFLNVDQAMADLAQFILHIKQTNVLLKNSSVILVGASYAASLSTWFMQEYPELARGAWVSSAPLKAQVDFYKYREVVSHAIRIAGGKKCSNRIKRAFQKLERLFAANELTRVEHLFDLCFPLNSLNELDVSIFFISVANTFSHVVQRHQDANQDIQKMCSQIDDDAIDEDIEALSQWWLSLDSICYNHLYSNYVSLFNQSKWEDNEFGMRFDIVVRTKTDSCKRCCCRQWTYQTCNEFGWFQTTNSNKTLFGSSIDLKLRLQMCNDFFGENFSQANIRKSVHRTNRVYGRNPNVRNVYSTYGQFDPWHAMGAQEDINSDSPTVVIPNEAHCSDLESINWTDSPELRASKERIFELVQQWIL